MPEIVVARDGSGQFETINEAIAAVKSNDKSSTMIHVKVRVYNEYVSFQMGRTSCDDRRQGGSD